jgi:hypothetical protein
MCSAIMLTSDERRQFFLVRRTELESLAEKDGTLKRQEWWSLEYYKEPYLVDATTPSLHKRYQDIVGNLTTLDQSGRISVLAGESRDVLASKITHVQEELFVRGIMPRRADDDIHLPNPTFPNVPPGLRILGGSKLPDVPYLVKIGEYSHMRAMIEVGEIRIAPASSFNDKSLAAAIKDNERELFAHYSRSDLQKTTLGRSTADKIDPEQSGEIVVKRTLPDFYAYCLTHKYDHRLLDDFHKDSVVLIREPGAFLKKLVHAVTSKFPDLHSRIDAISYYDPYCVEDWNPSSDGFLKHFRYAYQKEFRACFSVPVGSHHVFNPFFVHVGDMRSYAELLTISN